MSGLLEMVVQSGMRVHVHRMRQPQSVPDIDMQATE